MKEGIIMIYVLLNDDGSVRGSADTFEMIRVSSKAVRGSGLSFSEASAYARDLNAIDPTKNHIILPEPHGRTKTYRIAIAPKVGDIVSSVLNGIESPAGTIVKVSPSFKTVTTSTGQVFKRHDNSPKWTCGKAVMIKRCL